MLFKVFSDLHMEFDIHNTFHIPESSVDRFTTLLLCGDIVSARDLSVLEPLLVRLSNQFKNICYIAGNHEFYGGDFNETLIDLKEICSNVENVYFLEDSFVEFDDVRIIGSTLWTDFDNQNVESIAYARRGMNDFYAIKNITINAVIERHLKSKDYIFNTVKSGKDLGKRVVVMSHHLPSFKSVHEKYKKSKLNGAFTSNLDECIINSNPDIWTHGHTHDSVDYIIGNTRVLCNPRGYLGHEFNSKFTTICSYKV